jgi:hypothetical protein
MQCCMRNRPGEYARAQLWEKRREVARGSLWGLTLVAAIVPAFCVLLLVLPSPLWWRAFLLGFMTASILGIVIWGIDFLSGTHSLSLGRLGEQATAKAVCGRAQRRKGWRLINGLYFDGHGDVDHILVGPGGIFVLESKLTNVPWALSPDGLVGPPGDPLAQARRGAHKVELMLRHGREPFDVDVCPVLVVWGPGSPVIEGGWTERVGVLVLEGRQNRCWLGQLPNDVLSAEMVDSVTRTLETALDSRVGRATVRR